MVYRGANLSKLLATNRQGRRNFLRTYSNSLSLCILDFWFFAIFIVGIRKPVKLPYFDPIAEWRSFDLGGFGVGALAMGMFITLSFHS